MNKWQIKWLYQGERIDIIDADSLEAAIKRFREQYPYIPSIALYEITCVK